MTDAPQSGVPGATRWDHLLWWFSAVNANDPTRRTQALERLAQRGDVTKLLRSLRFGDGAIRTRTARALSSFSDPRIPAALVAALADRDESARAAALDALAGRGGARLREHLLEGLDDPAQCVRLVAIRHLGADPAMADILWDRVVTRGSDRSVAAAALRLVLRGPDPDRARLLLAMLAGETKGLHPLSAPQSDDPLLLAAVDALSIVEPSWRSTPAGQSLIARFTAANRDIVKAHHGTRRHSLSPCFLSLYVALCGPAAAEDVLVLLTGIDNYERTGYREEDAQGFRLPSPEVEFHVSLDYSLVRRLAAAELERRRGAGSVQPT